jgi:hypothetical protein
MKKIIAMLLVLVMAASLVACGGEKAPETTVAPETTAPAAPETTVAPETEAPETEATVAVMSYAEFAAAELETEVVVETYVQTIESWWNDQCHIYAQSEDGGYYIYGYACTEDEANALVPGTKILVKGYKTAWSGEIEIVDATIEILEGSYIVEEAFDATALLGTADLETYINTLVAFKGLTVAASTDANGNEVAFLYKWDGSGSQGDDIYFNVTDGTNTYTFTINAYMVGYGAGSDVYAAAEALNVGDVIDVEGFLYWYNGAQPHCTSIVVAE